jgi:hypothetical protein
MRKEGSKSRPPQRGRGQVRSEQESPDRKTDGEHGATGPSHLDEDHDADMEWDAEESDVVYDL